ncbi:hypothetical protein V8G54_024625, partial [Vigna mungo]
RNPRKGVRLWLDTFTTAEEVVRAYDVATVHIHEVKAKLNFPEHHRYPPNMNNNPCLSPEFNQSCYQPNINNLDHNPQLAQHISNLESFLGLEQEQLSMQPGQNHAEKPNSKPRRQELGQNHHLPHAFINLQSGNHSRKKQKKRP